MYARANCQTFSSDLPTTVNLDPRQSQYWEVGPLLTLLMTQFKDGFDFFLVLQVKKYKYNSISL